MILILNKVSYPFFVLESCTSRSTLSDSADGFSKQRVVGVNYASGLLNVLSFQVMDKHLAILAQKHIETKFVRVRNLMPAPAYRTIAVPVV